MANTKRDKMFTLMLSAQEHAMLTQMAAKTTIRTGKRTSAAEVLRNLAFAKGATVKFTAPAVEAQDAQGVTA